MKKKILAVDDNAVNLAAVEQALQEDYDVVSMISGSRLLKYLGGRTADLILLDIQMPVMDGREALRELRKLDNGANLPVIFLTALQGQTATEEDIANGVADYITKPFDREDLKRRVSAALGQ